MISTINCLRRQIEETQAGYESFHLKSVETPKPSRLVYKKLVSIKSEQPKQSQEKWHKEINIGPDENISWKAVYELAFKCTKNSKVIVFDFKFLHRRLATNTFLKKLGLVDDEVCNFCHSERESLYHLVAVLQNCF